MVSKSPDDTLRLHGMNLYLSFLRMLENTFSLGMANMVYHTYLLVDNVPGYWYQVRAIESLEIWLDSIF